MGNNRAATGKSEGVGGTLTPRGSVVAPAESFLKIVGKILHFGLF